LKFRFRTRNRLAAEQKAANLIKGSDQNSEIRKNLVEYQELLDKSELKEIGTKPLKVWQWAFLVLLTIPSTLSWFVTKWGLYFGKKLVEKKVKKDELYESIYYGVGLAHNLLMIYIGYPVVAILWGWKGVLAWFLIRVFSISYQHCSEFWEQHVQHRRWKKGPNRLKELREKVVDTIL